MTGVGLPKLRNRVSILLKLQG